MRADAFPKSNVISDLYSLTNLEPPIYKIFCQISAATKRDKCPTLVVAITLF